MDKSDKEFLKKNKDVLSYEEIIKLYKEGKITKEELEKKVKIRERFDKLNNDKEFEDYRNKEIAHAILDIGTALIPFGGGAKIGGKIIGAGIKKVAPKASEKVTKAIVNKAIEITEKEIKKLTTHTGKKIAETLVKKTPKDIATGALIGGIHGGVSASIDNKNPAPEIIKEGSVGAVIGLGASVIGGKIAQKIEGNRLHTENNSLKQLRELETKYYKNYNQKRTINHKELGEISFTQAGLETVSKQPESARNYDSLIEDIKNAKYVGYERPSHTRDDKTIKFHILENNDTQFLIAESNNKQFKYYMTRPKDGPDTRPSRGGAEPSTSIIPNSKSTLKMDKVLNEEEKELLMEEIEKVVEIEGFNTIEERNSKYDGLNNLFRTMKEINDTVNMFNFSFLDELNNSFKPEFNFDELMNNRMNDVNDINSIHNNEEKNVIETVLNKEKKKIKYRLRVSPWEILVFDTKEEFIDKVGEIIADELRQAVINRSYADGYFKPGRV